MTTHWATKFVGRSYDEVERCWGLVQACVSERHGVELQCPIRAARRWHRVQVLQPDDIIVMRGSEGRHVGYAIEADRWLSVLHATREGVVCVSWAELQRKGYSEFEFWRRRD